MNTARKWTALLLALVLCHLLGPAAVAAVGRTHVVPDGKPVAVKLKSGAKVHDYYAFGKQQPVTVTVLGPTTLTLFVRPVFRAGMPDTVRFGVLVREGNKDLAQRWRRARRGSAVLVDAAGETPGVLRKIRVKIPAGSHRLEILLLGDEAERAVARFSVPRKTVRKAYVPVAPLDAGETLTALVGERQVVYYPIDGQRTRTVRVVGPTWLRIISRRHFGAAERGKQPYTLVVEENGRGLRQAKLFTTRSTTVRYARHPDVVPGKDRVTVLKVPRGVHQYTIRVLGASPPPTVGVRFSLPQKDLGHSARRVK